jgi:hypothetical protein
VCFGNGQDQRAQMDARRSRMVKLHVLPHRHAI